MMASDVDIIGVIVILTVGLVLTYLQYRFTKYDPEKDF